MVLTKVLVPAFAITVIVLLGMAFFVSISSMGMYELTSIRSDVISSSMSLLSMHDDVSIQFGWDYIPFSIGVTNGGLLFVTESGEHPLSPYPEVIPILGSEVLGNFQVFTKKDPKSFNFTRLGKTKEAGVN